ncbi:Di-copper centre-containing protein [Xylariaceae sp. AK1471]|nr:Di-copper centre-containing protein [Xylariaceae sp. AK1471]
MESARAIVLFVALFFLSHGLGTAHGVKKYDYGHNTNLRIHKRQFSQSSTVGSLPLVDGQPQPRLEIRDLQKDDDQWNLYILALSWMQYTPQDSPFSWYQIAGIHGAPGLTWGNVEPLPGNEKVGYCHHVSILFPTWHRPYLVLYEQTMYSIVQFIASLWPPEDLDRVQKAAKRFRIPYWDWAVTPPAGESVLPLSISGSSIMNVSGPNGVQNISNPLFSFTFKPFNGSIFPDSPYNKWNETKRAPNPTSDPNAVSNNSFVANSFDSHLPSYQQRLYNLFANYPNYTHFSNEGWIGENNNGTFDSIESLHDSIHTIGGGGWGHLAIIAYSAFDPLFFLHHANVDRIFAMWQIIHNDTYVVPTAAVYASHTQNQGDMEDIHTPLQPFFVNTTAFWTSDMVRDHETFGYTYAEVVNKTREVVVAAINRLYTDYSPATMTLRNDQKRLARAGRSVHDQAPEIIVQRNLHKPRAVAWQHESSSHLPMKVVFKADSNGKSYREWIANIKVKKQALNSSFLIYLFLGTIPADSSSWQNADSLVGSLGVFAHNGRPRGAEHGKVTGTIPLTSALMRMVADRHVPSFDPEDIEPFLWSALELRVALLDGTIVDAKEVDGLGVSIVSSMVTAPTTENELPKWGEVESYFDLVA